MENEKKMVTETWQNYLQSLLMYFYHDKTIMVTTCSYDYQPEVVAQTCNPCNPCTPEAETGNLALEVSLIYIESSKAAKIT